jgi:WD40 repeat protein
LPFIRNSLDKLIILSSVILTCKYMRYGDTTIHFLILLFLSAALPVQAQNERGEDALFILNKHSEAVKSVAFSADGSLLATGSDDKTIIIWNTQTGEAITSIGDNFFPVKALQFFSNDELFVASGPDIKRIDFRGKILLTYPGKTAYIWSLDYNRSSGRITGGSYGKVIRVWDVATGKEVLLLEGHEKSTLPVCFNTAGDLILSGSLDQSVRLWDAGSGKELKKMEVHSGNIFSVAFHPDGRYAASASGDKTIRLWDLGNGRVVQSYPGHIGGVLDIDFSADGKHLLSGSADNTVILWETVSGNKLYSFVDHKAPVNDVEFSPDGKCFASASDDKTARIWKLEKRIYVDAYFKADIEKEVAASLLFNAKLPGETKQEYRERQDKADAFLTGLYDEYYQKYLQQVSMQNFDDRNQ